MARILKYELGAYTSTPLSQQKGEHQSNEHEYWLERQIEDAFESYEAGQNEFISNEEMNARMDKLKQPA